MDASDLGAVFAQDDQATRGRWNRVVLASRRWGQVRWAALASSPASDGGKKARSPGRARISR